MRVAPTSEVLQPLAGTAAVPPFYDPQELFALPVDIIDGYLILLGRVQPTFTGRGSGLTNETESKKSFTHEDKANLTLHFQALVSGNILDACLGRAHGREVRSLKHALSKFDHERQQSSAVEAYRNLFRGSSRRHFQHLADEGFMELANDILEQSAGIA